MNEFALDTKNKIDPKTLYLVATPIGNLADLSPRALKVLSECDFVAAEDTRNTLRLLTHFGIKKELVSYHEHNKADSGKAICARLLCGESCALVTDAGMPAISDPGEDIVKLCAEYGINVTSVPGCCAAVTALSLSALSTSRFVFEGFLPVSGKERETRLSEVCSDKRTVILYEAPHRLRAMLIDLEKKCGSDRKMALCRELTKLNEQIMRTTVGEALKYYSTNAPRGEYVLILDGADECTLTQGMTTAAGIPHTLDPEKRLQLLPCDHVAYYEGLGYSHMDAVKAAAGDRGLSKSSFYRLLENDKSKHR